MSERSVLLTRTGCSTVSYKERKTTFGPSQTFIRIMWMAICEDMWEKKDM